MASSTCTRLPGLVTLPEHLATWLASRMSGSTFGVALVRRSDPSFAGLAGRIPGEAPGRRNESSIAGLAGMISSSAAFLLSLGVRASSPSGSLYFLGDLRGG